MPKGAIVTQAEDFPAWYQEVVAGAELAENGPVRGTMVIRPWGYAIWGLMQADMDRRIKETGAQNASFPLFIPESSELEAEHVEGFSPELAVVTHGGGEQLEEPLVVRPTCETVVNQLLRQVGPVPPGPSADHQPLGQRGALGAAAPAVPAHQRVPLAGGAHRPRHRCGRAGDTRCGSCATSTATMVEVLGISVLTGEKTARERFAGANRTWTCEGMMGDGKALQMGTSHELGQNFARAFDITFTNGDGRTEYVWQTSWGDVHPADRGADHGPRRRLRAAPAPGDGADQVVVLVIKEGGEVGAAAEALVAELPADGHRVRLDDRTGPASGGAASTGSSKGVPVRVEVGPRDLAEGNVTLVTRHSREKQQVALAWLGGRPPPYGRFGPELLAEAAARNARTADVAGHWTRRSRRGASGFARIRMGALGPTARTV